MDTLSNSDQVEYLFHHLFLPPKLPGGDDMTALNSIFLTDFVLQSLQRFTNELGGEDTVTVQSAISMLQTMRDTTDSRGSLERISVRKVLATLSLHGIYLHHLILVFFPTNKQSYRLCRPLPCRRTKRRLTYSQTGNFVLSRDL